MDLLVKNWNIFFDFSMPTLWQLSTDSFLFTTNRMNPLCFFRISAEIDKNLNQIFNNI